MKASTITYSLLTLIAVVIILIYGKSILLPAVLAVMIWFIIRAVRNFVGKIKFGKKEFPGWLQNGVAFLLIFSVLGLVGKMLAMNIAHMSEVLPVYEKNITLLSIEINRLFNLDLAVWMKDFVGNFDLTSLLKQLLNSVSELFANAFMVLLYVLFLLLEEIIFPNKLKALFPSPTKLKNAKTLLTKLNQSINDYLFTKTLVSLITGVLSYIVLLIIGIDFAFFWAFVIFLLNYIPNIGSLVATIFPASIALLQTGSLIPFLWVLGSIGTIQVMIGNIIEPKVMGSSLNISPLIVLLALAFWGSIWGIVGMILSVPITVMMIIVFAQFPSTKNIAILLSENGKI